MSSIPSNQCQTEKSNVDHSHSDNSVKYAILIILEIDSRGDHKYEYQRE